MLAGHKIPELFQSEKEYIDTLIPFVRSQTPLHSFLAIEGIKVLGFSCAPWVQQLLSIFLSLTTISNANLAAMKHCQLYSSIQSGNPLSADAI